jgi:hypothetical protein
MITMDSHIYGDWAGSSYHFTKCLFNNNNAAELYTYEFNSFRKMELSLIDCELGDSTFKNKEYIDFGDGLGGEGSIIGSGSPTKIAILSLIASVVSIGISFALHKKKAVPAAANETAK